MQTTTVSYHKTKWCLEAMTESVYLAKIVWWPEEVSLKIKMNEKLESLEPHQVLAKPYRKRRPTLVDLHNFLNPPGAPPIDSDFLMESYKIIVWNCRGAGNERFKSNFRDMTNQHKPEMVALLETKVSLQSMGSFFKNLGYTRHTFSDPNGRSGGIWILWDPLRSLFLL